MMRNLARPSDTVRAICRQAAGQKVTQTRQVAVVVIAEFCSRHILGVHFQLNSAL